MTTKEVNATELQKGKRYQDIIGGTITPTVFEFIEARLERTIVMKPVGENIGGYIPDDDGNILFTASGTWYEVD